MTLLTPETMGQLTAGSLQHYFAQPPALLPSAPPPSAPPQPAALPPTPAMLQTAGAK